jgi:hypothetical protein
VCLLFFCLVIGNEQHVLISLPDAPASTSRSRSRSRAQAPGGGRVPTAQGAQRRKYLSTFVIHLARSRTCLPPSCSKYAKLASPSCTSTRPTRPSRARIPFAPPHPPAPTTLRKGLPPPWGRAPSVPVARLARLVYPWSSPALPYEPIGGNVFVPYVWNVYCTYDIPMLILIHTPIFILLRLDYVYNGETTAKKSSKPS